MPIMSKTVARKRLNEARAKLRAVNYATTNRLGDVLLSSADSQKIFKMDTQIENIIKKLK